MTRTLPSGDAKAAARPVLIVPGYGMNSYIFGYHPRGDSMVKCLAARGLEVWTVDLRGQGRSIRAHGNNRYGMADHTYDVIGSATKRLLLVGDPEQPIAHADPFLCNGAQERIFAPVADFLLDV